MRLCTLSMALMALLGSAFAANPPLRGVSDDQQVNPAVAGTAGQDQRELYPSYSRQAAYKYLHGGSGYSGHDSHASGYGGGYSPSYGGSYGGHGGYCKCGAPKHTRTYNDKSYWWIDNKHYYYAPGYGYKKGGGRRLGETQTGYKKRAGRRLGETRTGKKYVGRRLSDGKKKKHGGRVGHRALYGNYPYNYGYYQPRGGSNKYGYKPRRCHCPATTHTDYHDGSKWWVKNEHHYYGYDKPSGHKK